MSDAATVTSQAMRERGTAEVSRTVRRIALRA